MNKPLTHAGCVVFRDDKEKNLYLIISSSSDKNWVLPKGHIKKDEPSEEAALRELEEEAGIIGEIIQPLQVQAYHKKSGEEVVVQYYLVRITGIGKAKEKRQVRWERKKSVLKMLSFMDAQRVFQEALEAIGRMT